MNTTLKRTILLLTLILSSTVLLSAAPESKFYVKHVRVVAVYPHRLGIKVEYVSNTMKRLEKYLPNSWFEKTDSEYKSQIIYGTDITYPYMEIYYSNGKFSHVKLYVIKNYNDMSWGSFGNPNLFDKYFENADTTFLYQ